MCNPALYNCACIYAALSVGEAAKARRTEEA